MKLLKDWYTISINFSVVLFECRGSDVELSKYLCNNDELLQQNWRSQGNNSVFSKLQERRKVNREIEKKRLPSMETPLGMGRNKSPVHLVFILFRGEVFRWFSLVIQSNLALRLKKVLSYIYNPSLGKYVCSNLNLTFCLQKTETQSVSFHNIGTAVLVIAVLNSDSSGRTALR